MSCSALGVCCQGGGCKDNLFVCEIGECLWLHLPLIKQLMHDAGSLYSLPGSAVDYAFTTVPTYPSGSQTHLEDAGSSLAQHYV